MGERLIFDIETNGLLPELHSVWCIAVTDMETGEEFYYGPAVPRGHRLASDMLCEPAGTVDDAVLRLTRAVQAVAHNGIGFDYPALEKLYPDFVRPAEAWDSMVAAKMVWPPDALADRDFALYREGKMPVSLVKRHSLKAWGVRLGEHKDEYVGDFDKYPEDGTEETRKLRWDTRWDEWNVDMASYMMQDNRPCLKLWNLIERRVGWVDPEKADLIWPRRVFQTEHLVHHIIADQEGYGVRFDRDAGSKLEGHLRNEKARLERALRDVFGSWWQHTQTAAVARTSRRSMAEHPDVTTPRVSEKTGKELKAEVGPPVEQATAGSCYTHVSHVDFNPGSRDHLGQRLQAVYGWKPKKVGQNGKPTVDESVLQEIPEAVMPLKVRETILASFVVDKTLGNLAKGQNAWMRISEPDSRIHGRVDPLGAVTGRPTHSKPNMSAVPAVTKEKVPQEDGTTKEVPVRGLPGRYGMECRELFTADEGWEQTGVDASSLELIMLGHYLFPHDGGAFSERVCDPTRDAHKEHAALTGLTRGDAKTATYLYVYGGSAYKLSQDISIDPEEIPGFLSYRGLPMLLKSLERRFDADFVRLLDDAQKAKIAKARTIILKFESGIDGIKELKDSVAKAAEKRWLKSLDGRKLFCRSPHSSLNTILQSGGIECIKEWMVLLHAALRAEGLVHGVDYKQVLWSHDEFQFTHRPGLGPRIRELANETIKEAGRVLGLRGELRSDGSTGKNWLDTH